MRKDLHPIFVLMGPAGSGKTTVGRRLAQLCHLPFLDADEFHSAEAVLKMSRGEPLSDADRASWLEHLTTQIDQAAETGLVLACSALKVAYRRQLGMGQQGRHLVYLDVPRQELARRLRLREAHFAGVDLLDSQLSTLEPPHLTETYDGTASPEQVATAVIRRVGFPLDWTSDQGR